AGSNFQDGKRAEEILHQQQVPRRRGALGCACPQLGFRDDAHRDVFPALGQKVAQNGGVFLERIDAGIRIEQEFHRSEDRFSTLPCGGRTKSSGTPAKDSTHFSGHWKAGSNTTACPSRRTSTVSVSKRNSFGRLTAWLLPVQNTLAFLVFMIGINDTYQSWRCQASAKAASLEMPILVESAHHIAGSGSNRGAFTDKSAQA